MNSKKDFTYILKKMFQNLFFKQERKGLSQKLYGRYSGALFQGKAAKLHP